jgi:ribosomal protein L7/L12
VRLLVTVIVIIVALLVLRWTRQVRERPRMSGTLPPKGEGTDEDVAQLVRAGRKMSAIKLFREIHKTDLKTAKEAVDEMTRTLREGR